MPHRDWLFRLEDILLGIAKIDEYTRQLTFAQFRESSVVMEAVFYNLTIIGEAARFVPKEVEDRYPNIDWHEIRAMRNILVHEYFGADLGIIWRTAREIPPRSRQIARRKLAVSGSSSTSPREVRAE